MTSLTAWIDGEYAQSDQPHVHLFDHALHYGTGVFEGIRVYETKEGPAAFRLDAHLERMERGTQTLGFDLDVDALATAASELCRINKLNAAYVRPLAWLGGGGLTLDLGKMTLRQAVAVLPWTSHLGDSATTRGIRMMSSSYVRNPAGAMPPLKLCGGYVNSCLAKLEATRNGFDEALFLDGDWVCEATGENVFMVEGGRVVAVEHPDALPGITRATLLELTGGTSRRVTFEELMAADEIFVCGTSAEVTAVRQLNDRPMNIGPLTRDIAATYQDIVHGRDPQFRHWLTYMEEAWCSTT